MSKLEDLQPNAAVRGILPDALVTVVNVQWFGSKVAVVVPALDAEDVEWPRKASLSFLSVNCRAAGEGAD